MSDENATPCQEAPEAWVGNSDKLRAEAAKECARCPLHMFAACQKLAAVEPFGVMAGHDYGVIGVRHEPKAPIPEDVKECEACGATVQRGKRDRSDWAKLRFCSRRCVSSSLRRQGLPTVKVCEWCGDEYTRGGRGAPQWMASRFCGVACSGASRRKDQAS